MSGQLTNFGETQILTWLSGQAVTQPTALFVGLFTAAPTSQGGGTEVTGGGYARVPAALSLTTGADPATLSNAAAIAFPTPTADWGSIVDVGIFDAQTGGNLWAFGTVNASGTTTPTPQQVSSGQAPTIPAGALKVPLN